MCKLPKEVGIGRILHIGNDGAAFGQLRDTVLERVIRKGHTADPSCARKRVAERYAKELDCFSPTVVYDIKFDGIMFFAVRRVRP